MNYPGVDKKELLRQTINFGAITLVSSLIRYGFEKAYRLSKGTESPKNPFSKKGNHFGAILWAAATGAVIGIVSTYIRPVLDNRNTKLLKS